MPPVPACKNPAIPAITGCPALAGQLWPVKPANSAGCGTILRPCNCRRGPRLLPCRDARLISVTPETRARLVNRKRAVDELLRVVTLRTYGSRQRTREFLV